MSAWLAAFHFLRPWWLLLALAWVPLLLWLWRSAHGGGRLRRLVDAALLPHVLVGSGKVRHASAWLLLATAVLTTLALAGPTWQRLPQPMYDSGAAQVVVVSLSRRMLARDVTPDRMQRVRYKLRALLHANDGGRNALVAYAGEAFVVAPLTGDAHALDDLIDDLAPDVMPVSGDAPAKGIAQGVKLLRRGDARHGSLVLMTDRVNDAAVAAARKAEGKGIRVSVMGVGGSKPVTVTLPGGGKLTDGDGHVVTTRQHPRSLKALAQAGGGVYVPMSNDATDVSTLAGQLRANRRAPSSAFAHADRWRDIGPWLLLPVLLLAALAFRRGWLLALPLVILPWTSVPAHAGTKAPATAATTATTRAAKPAHVGSSRGSPWSSWWLNDDQRAARALQHGHARQAQQLARSPALRGSAAYRDGDYAAAARNFAQAPGADAAYNLGNAQARQGHYRKAIKAYDKALKMDADMADARANRKAVKAWLKKHRPRSHAPQSGSSRNRSKKRGTHGAHQQKDGSRGQPNQEKHADKSRTSGQPRSDHRSPPATAASRDKPARAASGRKPPEPLRKNKSAGQRHAEERAARKALRQEMKGRKARSPRKSSDFRLGQMPASAGSSRALPPAMRRALQRVQDDPGGLLRRKFQLEYRERQQGRQGGSER